MSTRDALIEANLDLAERIARRLARTIPSHGMLVDELEGEARYLLVLAAEQYDKTRNESFRNWAAWFISRRLHEKLRRKPLRDATHNQLSDQYEGRSSTESPEEFAMRAELCGEIDRAIGTLPARSRKIVEIRYLEDASHRLIGPRVGLKTSRISQLHAEALKTLREELNGLKRAV
jgi:RNA polymerase sigma factor (sigma-70 family)